MRSLGELMQLENSFKDKALGVSPLRGGMECEESGKANRQLLGRGEPRGGVYYKEVRKRQQVGQFVA